MRMRLILAGLCLLVTACSAPPNEQAAGEAGSGTENAMAENEWSDNAIENASNAIDNAANAADNSSSPGNQTGPDAMIRCAAFRANMTQARCDDLVQQQRELEAGVAAFNPQRAMTLNKPVRLTLTIGAQAEAADVVRTAGGTPGQAATVGIRIGRYMTATLTGSAFQIVPVGNPQRDLGASSAETWQWDVTPLSRGPQTLQAQIETFAESQGERTRVSLFRSDPVSIDVAVTGEQARADAINQASRELETTKPLLDNLAIWLGSLAAVVLAAGIVWWRIRNFGRRPKDDDPEPE
jgi:hypothetical protein